MLGLDGPGGWVALAGSAGALATSLTRLLPGVACVAINPPEPVQPADGVSVLLSGAWPLKTHSMRGVILGEDASDWREAALATTLPGFRTVGCGEAPAGGGVQDPG